jgi:hypothetical protein
MAYTSAGVVNDDGREAVVSDLQLSRISEPLTTSVTGTMCKP